MLYQVMSIKLTPGVRFPAIEALGNSFKENYGLETQVLINETGPVYRHHFVIRYESLSQYDELKSKLFQSQQFGEWFDTAQNEGYFDWPSAETALYHVA